MKILGAILFSFLSLAGILRDLSVYISFKANQEYIAITMCTSRGLEDNTCNGSCYLTKQLEMVHQHEQESDRQAPQNIKEHINYYLEEISEEIKPAYTIHDSFQSDYLFPKVTRGFPSGIFEPPKYS